MKDTTKQKVLEAYPDAEFRKTFSPIGTDYEIVSQGKVIGWSLYSEENAWDDSLRKVKIQKI